MNWQRTVVAIAGFIVMGCHHKVSTYENNLGIQPAVVAQIDTSNYTTILWLDSTQNFGVVNEGDSVLIKYKFKNTGSTVLFISEVEPSCGCVVPFYSKKPILPGEEGELKASFDSHYRKGFIQKSILVKSNTSNGTNHILRFSGEVKERPAK